MANQLKVALVGYGYWGPNLLRNFLQHPHLQVQYVVDLDTKNLARAKVAAPAVVTTTNFDEVLQDTEIDLVALAVPTKLHFPLAQRALKAKKHVLIEKPLTQTTKDARKLQELAKQQRRHVFVDHPYIFSAPIQYLRQALTKKKLGKLFYLESRRLNLGLIQSDINVIDDLSPHDFSIVDYLTNGQVPTHVTAQGASHTRSGQVERALIELHYPNNVSATIQLSWLSPLKVRELFCVGSKKMIIIDDTLPDEKLRIYDKAVEFHPKKFTPFKPFYRSGDVVIPRLSNTEPLLAMIDACYQKIVHNTKAPHEIDAAIRVVSLIERSQKALTKYLKGTYGS